jgi:hypothetical protein
MSDYGTPVMSGEHPGFCAERMFIGRRTFLLPPPHEDFCFQQAVGEDGHYHEKIKHSSSVFCKIEPFNLLAPELFF